MAFRNIVIACGLALAWASAAQAQEPPTGATTAKEQLEMLKSADPKLAANKKLVFDMYREIVNAGRVGNAAKFFTPEYIQHNPNVKSGRDELVKYIRQTRPERPIPEAIGFPVIAIMAEGDFVTVATVSYLDDVENPGKKYANTHFDMYKLVYGRDGKPLIHEHWDHVEKSRKMLSFDPNASTAKPD